jgi:hypothetical protein
MQVILQGIKMELDLKVSKEEQKFLEKMQKKGFLLTYYQGEDKEGAKDNGSIKEISLKLKSKIKI